jgi:sporulation protein YlmC with PRC-barrel domain
LKKLSEFQFMRVETEGGRFLGHVFDLRSWGVPEHGLTREKRVVNEIVYGKLGLLARLGIIQADADTIPWESVKDIRDGRIIVEDRSGGQSRSRER